MLTKYSRLNYEDLDKELRNNDMVLNPENACRIIWGKGIWDCKTTELVRQFLEDDKSYMVIPFGLFGGNRLHLIAKIERCKCAPKSAPTMTMVKQMTMEHCVFWDDGTYFSMISCPKRMESLMETIASLLKGIKEPGLYTIEKPAMMKAQTPGDRSGFYKVWNNGILVDERNYGDCSMSFSVVGVWVA